MRAMRMFGGRRRRACLWPGALILTLLNPLILGDVGFQLSFMATLGLIVLVPPLERITFDLLQRWERHRRLELEFHCQYPLL